MYRRNRYGSVPAFDRGKVQRVICLVSPDIDYTSNCELVVGDIYLSDRSIENLDVLGEVVTGDIWDLSGNYMGNYFLRDFEFISELREKQIASIFND